MLLRNEHPQIAYMDSGWVGALKKQIIITTKLYTPYGHGICIFELGIN